VRDSASMNLLSVPFSFGNSVRISGRVPVIRIVRRSNLAVGHPKRSNNLDNRTLSYLEHVNNSGLGGHYYSKGSIMFLVTYLSELSYLIILNAFGIILREFLAESRLWVAVLRRTIITETSRILRISEAIDY